jgi:gliding motility-associated-like protein
MPKHLMRLTYCTIILLFLSVTGYTQASLCPPNIDFKKGDFSNWECRSGIVQGVSGVNTVTWTSNFPDPTRHRIIPTTSKDRDQFGDFPVQCPGAATPSVKLGSAAAGHEADGLFYTFTIPASATKFSLLYQYAIVLQNPGHQAHEQPRFRARIIDVLTDQEVNCVSFDFTSSGSLPGFQPSSVLGTVIFKNWTAVSVDLSSYAGREIRIEFITTDCVFQEHFGYAYINVSSICNGSIMGSNYCEGESSTTLTAPFGFAKYQWFRDNSFSTEVGSSQSLQLDINSVPVGSVLPVIIHPFPGYGCVDTLYASIGTVQKPFANAGPDITSCSKQQTKLGSIANDIYEYSWDQPNLLSNPNVSDPFIIAPLVAPTNFIVKTTDLLSGCFSTDTVRVTPTVVDTSTASAGNLLFCPDDTPAVTLDVINTATQVQWYEDNMPISGATGFTFRPAADGTYWAQIKQGGCTDTSRQYVLRRTPLPKPGFVTNRDIQCINKPVVFLNRTTIDNNEPVNYLWRFSDGSTATNADTEKSFSRLGEFTVTLIATSGSDCTDTIQKTIMVVNSCDPLLPTAFTPNKDGKNDIFKPSLMAAKGLKRFSVFNRWGNLVFTTAKEGEGWDGTNKGVSLPPGVFVWTLEYINTDNKQVVEKGTVTLIR